MMAGQYKHWWHFSQQVDSEIPKNILKCKIKERRKVISSEKAESQNKWGAEEMNFLTEVYFDFNSLIFRNKIEKPK